MISNQGLSKIPNPDHFHNPLLEILREPTNIADVADLGSTVNTVGWLGV